jgi:pyrroline-5-carboxylate reductase
MPVIPSLAILGGGKMGEALVRGLLDARRVARGRLVVGEPDAARRDHLAKRYRIRTDGDNARAVRKAGAVIVAVKPLVVKAVLDEIRGALGARTTVVSIAAGVSLDALERALDGAAPVVRAMPNTPCLVREGMTVLCAGSGAGPRDLETAREIFGALGRCLVLDEKLIDAVTALSGSGPAFQFVILDALADGGVRAGLPRDVAVELAAQTMRGAARMVLETREHPARLKDAVATPGGCTVEGLLELEEGGVRAALIKAVVRAARRAGELAGGR